MDVHHKQLIGELLHRTAYLMDMRSYSELEACFDANATFTLAIAGQGEASMYRGSAEIMNLIKGAATDDGAVRRHVISNIFFAETGADRAKAVSYMSLFATSSVSADVVTTGVYEDVVSRTGIDGGWQIIERSLVLDRQF